MNGIADFGTATGKEIAEAWKKNASLLKALDRTAVVELAIVEAFLGVVGDEAMERQIAECLPADDRPRTLGASGALSVCAQHASATCMLWGSGFGRPPAPP